MLASETLEVVELTAMTVLRMGQWAEGLKQVEDRIIEGEEFKR